VETQTIVKGSLVFVLTFGMFVLLKQASPSASHQESTLQDKSPDSTLVKEEFSPTEAAPTQVSPELPARQAEQSEAVPSSTASFDSPSAATSLDSAPQEVVLLLGSWRQAIVANDAHLESTYYAPTIHNYYGRADVSTQSVEADKQAFIDHGNKITGLSLQNVSVENLTAESMRIRLTKNVAWNGNNGPVQRLISSTLDFQKFADGWKITGEQDAKK
jgi:hypothetical protein